MRGIAFRLDLDKTYLATQFESFRQLVKIPFETAADKVHMPGVPELVRALRRCATETGFEPRVFFLSASPPQLGRVIREKLASDGIEVDGIVFKDQLRDIVRGRWRNLREQVGYKLAELLESRLRGAVARHEILFGDDWESDPVVYSLYADILTGAMEKEELAGILATLGVARRSRRRILKAAEQLAGEVPEVVEHIFIRLERRTPPARFQGFGPRLVATFNYLQTAAVLHETKRMDLPGVVAVAAALKEDPRVQGESLRDTLDDLVLRGQLRLATRNRVLKRLEKEGLAARAAHEKGVVAWCKALRERWRRRPPSEPFPIDYAAMLRREAE
ncbi:MAG: phosphatase domain-containing protein [Deltaproteobacteria bacterium]